MSRSVEVLTADTKQGQRAVLEVMAHSYTADMESAPASWVRALVVDGVPVSFIVVNPDRQLEHPGGDLRYAFICDVATREDRRGEGYFRQLMTHTFSSLRAAATSLVVTHGRCQLYRRFGFDVFTHHCGIFATPELIERNLGTHIPEGAEQILTVEEGQHLHDDLLLVTDVRAEDLTESRAALEMAAALARERNKTRILFEHPAAPSYGSRYPIYPSLETPLVILARACGARVCTQGASPESEPIPDADWIAVLDAASLLDQTLQGRQATTLALPEGAVCFDTDTGPVTIESRWESLAVSNQIKTDAIRVEWPASALAQLVTGYRSIEALCTIHRTSIPARTIALLGMLFPRRWRLSRNESWTYRH